MQIPVEVPVPEASGADTQGGSGGFQFQRVSMQIANEVAQGSDAGIR